ncbi:MAG: DMT family transporter [Synergistales bacterium]|nr:DMT family transporter [Synergistales bacterium]
MSASQQSGGEAAASPFLALGMLMAATAVVSWGASFTATKIALRGASPLTIIWIRFGLGIVILLPVLLGKGRSLPRGREWLTCGLLGFLGVPVHQLLQTTGLKTAQAATSAWIISTMPVFIALLGFCLLGERLRRIGVLGIALAAGGVLLVVSNGDLAALKPGGAVGFGDFLIFCSAVNWAVYTVLSRRWLGGDNPTRTLLWAIILGWLMTTALYVLQGPTEELMSLSAATWWSLAFLGFLCSGLAYAFWNGALQILPASHAGVFMYLNPLSATAVAAVLLGEAVTWATLSGGAAILTGVWMVNRSR